MNMRFPDDDPLAARLRDALSSEAAMVTPSDDGLQQIRDGIAGADRPAGAIPGQRLATPSVIPRAPAGDGLLTDTQDGGDIEDGVTQLPGTHRTRPQGCEDIVRLATPVG